MSVSHTFKDKSLWLTFPYMLFPGAFRPDSSWDLQEGRHRQLGTRGRGEESSLPSLSSKVSFWQVGSSDICREQLSAGVRARHSSGRSSEVWARVLHLDRTLCGAFQFSF